MSDFLGCLFWGIIAWIIGGLVGEVLAQSWAPYCWYGLAAGFGILIVEIH